MKITNTTFKDVKIVRTKKYNSRGIFEIFNLKQKSILTLNKLI